ncbi:MAG: DUF167 domain-containing protein [Planctomycetes bacterium]|jgi:hypothetical protein|nr:DUF167 domain-containing protein [Planctomycetota bacterium]
MADASVLSVLVHPGAREERLGPLHAGALRVAVREPPERGKANEAVVALLAGRLGVPRSALSVVRGGAGRRKAIRIEGVSREALARFLASFE